MSSEKKMSFEATCTAAHAWVLGIVVPSRQLLLLPPLVYLQCFHIRPFLFDFSRAQCALSGVCAQGRGFCRVSQTFKKRS